MAHPQSDHKPPAGMYSVKQVAKLFELPERKLRYWSQTGFVMPSERHGSRPFYSFRDLVAVKVAKTLVDQGVPVRKVRRTLVALKANLPDVEISLADVRLRIVDDRVIIDDEDHSYEAPTGQLVFDFSLAGLREAAAEVLTFPERTSDEEGDPSSAFEWFQRGCDLEAQWDGAPADVAGFEAAKAAYERALELDDRLAAAWTNLGGLHAECGAWDEAQHCFEQAVANDPDQPEAACNLAELLLRRGDADGAISAYRQILRTNPDHAEAHYGVARALLEVGGRGQALAHLERFVSAVGMADGELMARRDCALEVIASLRAAKRESP